MVFILIGVYIITYIICVLLGVDSLNIAITAFLITFLAFIMIQSTKDLDRKRYRCIENNLYMESDNLINQNKKCKIDSGIIYQVEENGDLVKKDIER